MGSERRLIPSRILCPVDVLDPEERGVLEYASRLADALGAELHALHVYDVPGFVDPGPEIAAVQAFAERALSEQRERFAELIAHLPGGFAEPHLVPGSPSRRIPEEADRLGAGLVVMGTHARRGLRRLALGSVAERVARAASVPVLTVPREADVGALPRSILVPHDLSEPSKRALRYARSLHVPLHASVATLHVMPEALAGREGPSWLTDSARGRYTAMLEDALRADVSEIFGPEEQAVRRSIGHGDVVEAVLVRQAALNAQLVVVGASGKSGTERLLLGSVTIELLRRCPVPVLMV